MIYTGHGKSAILRAMKLATFLLCLLAVPAWADVTSPSGKTVECYCTDTQGLRIELGETICLRVDGRAFMAKCDMSLNSPIWRDTGEGCLSSRLAPSLRERLLGFEKPAVQTCSIDAPVGPIEPRA